YGLLVVAAVVTLGAVLATRVEQQELGLTEQRLRSQAVLIREILRGTAAPGSDLQARVTALRDRVGARVTLIADDGRVLADSDADPELLANHATRPEVLAAREHGVGRDTRRSESVPESFMYVALRGDGTGPAAFVRVALSLGVIEQQLACLRRTVWLAALATAAAALGPAYLPARGAVGAPPGPTRGARAIPAGGFAAPR